MTRKESIWQRQNNAIRHPSEVFGVAYEQAGISGRSLEYAASRGFSEILHSKGITLVVSREYENLLIALSSEDGLRTTQSFFHLPHPSGIVANREKGILHVASTRNPNQIFEFKVTRGNLDRTGIRQRGVGYLLPARSKLYPGQYYFHDLATDGSNLYANAVGLNSIIRVDLGSSEIDRPVWWPECIESSGVPDFTANYIQLNSIALGSDLEHSYFSASASRMSNRRPGHLNFPVDGKGIIFSGRTRKAEYHGLTRPHSARLHGDRLWVANSGYGEAGYFEGHTFVPIFRCDGWTRGLCFLSDVLFVGVSRVLPRFQRYAPGIRAGKSFCSIAAFHLKSGEKIGEVEFPFGNQIFGIDYLASDSCRGFPFFSTRRTTLERQIFSVSY